MQCFFAFGAFKENVVAHFFARHLLVRLVEELKRGEGLAVVGVKAGEDFRFVVAVFVCPAEGVGVGELFVRQ